MLREGIFVGCAVLQKLTELGKIGIVLELYGLKFFLPVVYAPITEFDGVFII